MTMLMTMATQLHPGPWHEDGATDAPAWWPVFPITFGLFWVAVVVAGFYLVRRRIAAGAAQADPMTRAQSVLAERFARGEIDEDEYHTRLSTLRHGA
ncbi:SHOCT domain-containing protein [Actinomadura fulvescens]|uniref:SHOCT domain-containing protein n=1 Tax=Actinomadura fulvescens TaxID=46160 RepID=A0ABP6CIQ6_9ACTN